MSAHRYRPGFIAHLRKYGIDRAQHRRAKTALAALVELRGVIHDALIAEESGSACSVGDVVCTLVIIVHGENGEYP